jgi:hypothetical protein
MNGPWGRINGHTYGVCRHPPDRNDDTGSRGFVTETKDI